MTAEPVSAPTPSPTTPAPSVASESLESRAAAMVEEVKKTLEYQLANKVVTVTVRGKTLKLKKWGLTKTLSLGSRVHAIVERVQSLIPDVESLEALQSPTILMSLLASFGQDVMLIVAQSIIEPFHNANEAIEWLDEECNHQDLFDLSIVVWEMNFAGQDLGKLTKGLTGVTERINKLLSKM